MELIKEKPVRILELNGETFFCGRDIAILFKKNKPYDSIKTHCRNGNLRLFEITTRQGRETEIAFLTYEQAFTYVKKQLLFSKRANRFDADQNTVTFLKELEVGNIPSILQDTFFQNTSLAKNCPKTEVYQLILKINRELISAINELYGA